MSQPVELSIAGWRLSFTRRADRFAHQIAVAEGAGWRRLLASHEGEGAEPWPPSPPLQELHIEPRGDQHTVALLVGRAGPGHWSLSLELDGRRAHACRLIYDVACRVGAAPGWLGTCYRLADEVSCRVEGPDCRLLWPGGAATLRRLGPPGGPALNWRAENGVIFLDAPAPGPSWPATERWGYELIGATPK